MRTPTTISDEELKRAGLITNREWMEVMCPCGKKVFTTDARTVYCSQRCRSAKFKALEELKMIKPKTENKETALLTSTPINDNPEKKPKHINADILIGRYLKTYILGVEEPTYYEITGIETTPENYEKRDITLTLDGVGIEKMPLDDYKDFLKHKEIEIRDSKGEPYILQLAKQKEVQFLIDAKSQLKELEEDQVKKAEEQLKEVEKQLKNK